MRRTPAQRYASQVVSQSRDPDPVHVEHVTICCVHLRVSPAIFCRNAKGNLSTNLQSVLERGAVLALARDTTLYRVRVRIGYQDLARTIRCVSWSGVIEAERRFRAFAVSNPDHPLVVRYWSVTPCKPK